jgi:hypothetical protein
MKSLIIFISLLLAIFMGLICPIQAATTSISDIQIFPSDYVWNVPIDTLPVHQNSTNFIASNYGSSGKVIPGFGYSATSGYTYDVVDSSATKYNIAFKYPASSFTGIKYPIPYPLATIHGAFSNGTCNVNAGDCNAIIIDRSTNLEYEFFGMSGTQYSNGSWYAKSAGVFNLSNYTLTGRGTATAAGTPLLVGCMRYDEIEAGEINHAIRLALPFTRYGWNNYTWPAVFGNSIYVNNWTTNYPRMGERFRLKASFDISGYSPENQVILNAMKKYGLILTDNGDTRPDRAWQISGIRDSRWNWSDLVLLTNLKGTDFEAVDESSLMINGSSGQVTFKPKITVDTPGGGESWIRGTVPGITWTSIGNAGANIKIELLKGGVLVQTLSSTTANDGTFSSWSIPAGIAIGSDYKIRITSLTNSTITDTSDRTFNITDPIVVTTPNGGQTWSSGTTPMITWSSTGNNGKDVKVELLKAGSVVQSISVSTPNDGTFNSWTIPSGIAAGTDYKVRVTSLTNPLLTDTSDNTFSIGSGTETETQTPAITITSPQGGESWSVGTTHAITWTSSGSVGSTLKIELLKAGSVAQIISVATANDGSFSSWTVPSGIAAGTDYKVRITSLSSPSISGTSNNNFNIGSDTQTSAITILSPNGGESLARGTTPTITWTSGSVGSTLKIELLKAGSVVQIISVATANDGSFGSWTVPSGIAAGTDYKIRITSLSNSSATDTSNNYFNIS